MEITAQTAEQLRITAEEFEMIKQKLGRTPNFTELCTFSAMWSEHCSYKNSIKWLKTLPREGGRMLVAAGEEWASLATLRKRGQRALERLRHAYHIIFDGKPDDDDLPSPDDLMP